MISKFQLSMVLIAAVLLPSPSCIVASDPAQSAEVTKLVSTGADELSSSLSGKKEVSDKFQGSVRKAIRQGIRSGKITRAQGVRIKVAMISPAFREHVKSLAVIQIASSGEQSEEVSYDENGKINVDGINWEGLISFLEALLPLILQLIDALSLELNQTQMQDVGSLCSVGNTPTSLAA